MRPAKVLDEDRASTSEPRKTSAMIAKTVWRVHGLLARHSDQSTPLSNHLSSFSLHQGSPALEGAFLYAAMSGNDLYFDFCIFTTVELLLYIKKLPSSLVWRYLLAAAFNGVLPPALATEMSAPLSSNSFTTSIWPFIAARYRGIRPASSPIDKLAPAFTRASITCLFPESAAALTTQP